VPVAERVWYVKGRRAQRKAGSLQEKKREKRRKSEERGGEGGGGKAKRCKNAPRLPIQTNNHASEPHTHVMSNENKFPLKKRSTGPWFPVAPYHSTTPARTIHRSMLSMLLERSRYLLL